MHKNLLGICRLAANMLERSNTPVRNEVALELMAVANSYVRGDTTEYQHNKK